jgi:hypothetical protein
MTRGFLRTMAEVAQRPFVTLGALGSWRAHGRGLVGSESSGPPRYRLPDVEGLVAQNEYSNWLCVVSLQRLAPVGRNESALMTETPE